MKVWFGKAPGMLCDRDEEEKAPEDHHRNSLK